MKMIATRSSIFIYFAAGFLFLQEVQGQCDGMGPLILNATSSPQYFTSPNYPANYPSNSDCSWRIEAPNVDDKIIINIEDYDSESTTSDYMDLYDGYNSSATLVIRMAITNRKALNAFVSSEDVLFITFVSDYAIQYYGFQILYFSNDTANQAACDATLDVTSQEQVLMSPNLPGPYNEFHTCNWTFSSDTGILFQIKLLDMGGCGQSHLRFYDGNSTDDNQLATECSTALTYEFDDVTTTGFVGHIAWTVNNQSTDYYGFMLVYRTNVVTTTTTTTTTTTVPTTTLAPSIFDNCTASGAYMNATISPNFDYLYSPDFLSGQYPNNKFCRWYITAPDDYAVEAYFDNATYAIERNAYCSYDYVILYDGNTTSDTMLNKFCGFDSPDTAYRSSGTEMLIVFSSDYTITYAGFRIRIKAVDNTYPGCAADYTTYSVLYNRLDSYTNNNSAYINNISTTGFGTSDYALNLDVFWLFTSSNTTHYRMVLDIISISIERSRGCIYDRLVLYDGPCIKDGVLDTVCGNWAKQWDLSGPEYLLHFHSDFYVTEAGFLINYYAEEIAVPTPLLTSTTTFGPPVGAVVDVVKEMLANYSNEDLPTRNLSAAIQAYVDFFLVGINGVDEVEQKLTFTGQFEVTWEDQSLSWDPTKRQGVVQVLLPQNDVWKPDIALINGFEKITAMGAKFMFIDVDYNGSCIWKPYQVMESVCKVDMTHYPYDRQTCILKFGTWSTDDSEVITELGSLGLQIHPNFQENAEWRLIATETRQVVSSRHKIVEFHLTLERNSRYVTYYMTIPIVMLAVMNAFTFVVPCESGEKTGYSITIFLSFVVLLIINNGSLPDNSDTISLYAAYVLTMTILSALALIISTLQIRAMTFEKQVYPISKRMKNIINVVKKIELFLSCEYIDKHSKQNHDKTEEIELNHKKTENDSSHPLKHGTTDSGSSGYGSSTSEKKKAVAFKLENEEIVDKNDTVKNDRFSIPRKNESSQVTLERETTLFEENTLIRRQTSYEIHMPTNRKPERPASSDASSTTGDIKNENVANFNQDLDHTFEDRSQELVVKIDNNTMIREGLNDKTIELGNQIDNNIVSEPNTLESAYVEGIAKETDAVNEGKLKSSALDAAVVIDRNRSVKENLALVKDDHTSISDEDNAYNDSVDTFVPNTPITMDDHVASNHGSQQNANDVGDIHTNNDLYEQHPTQSESHEKYSQAYERTSITSNNTNEEVDTNQIAKNVLTQSDINSNVGDDVKQDSVSLSKAGELHIPDCEETGVSQVKSVGQHSRSLIAEITELQPVLANEVKMNCPVSTTEDRPLSFRSHSSAGDRGFALATHGRALSGATNRSVSTRDGRALSVLSKRPISIISRNTFESTTSQSDNAVLLFGSEETESKTPYHEIDSDTVISDDRSNESTESSSVAESCDTSEEDDISWPDVVACTDVVFFLIYSFITTIMSLVMFITMIKAN